MIRITLLVFALTVSTDVVRAADLPPRDEILSRQASLSFSVAFDTTLRSVEIVPETKALLFDLVKSPEIHDRIRYSSALALLRGGACSNYREMSVCAGVLHAVAARHDQARALAVLRFFLSHVPRELTAKPVHDAMTAHGWNVKLAEIEQLLPSLAGTKLPLGTIDVAP